jgi:hypothetical protein
MWAITNLTNFKADRAFTRDAEGAEIWVVAARATFEFDTQGRVARAQTQQDVCIAPVYFGEPGRSSLQYDQDLVRTKSGTDILVHAHAHAPGGKPAAYVDVGWAVGPVTKQLRVHGDRVWERRPTGLEPSEPVPFVSLPIRYERAWGGLSTQGERDPANPVGIGRTTSPGNPVPNCEFSSNPICSPQHDGAPAGFGPIAHDWQPRLALAGTFDDDWQKNRHPLPPENFHDDYLCCAPKDQRAGQFLSGGEDVVLKNLTPEGLVRFQLPRIPLAFVTHIDGGAVHHSRILHTVILEPEERQIILVWQMALRCHHTLETLENTIVYEKTRLTHVEQTHWPEVGP